MGQERGSARAALGALFVMSMLGLAACGAPAATRGPSTATGPERTSVPTTVSSGSPGASTTVPPVSPTTSTSIADAFSAIAGWYDGSTGSSGVLYIRADGASRFRLPDSSLCSGPACSDATAPIVNEDFSLHSLTSTGPGSYVATGTVTGYSSTVAVPQTGVGAAITVNISANGDLTFANSPSDVLVKGPPPPGYS